MNGCNSELIKQFIGTILEENVIVSGEPPVILTTNLTIWNGYDGETLPFRGMAIPYDPLEASGTAPITWSISNSNALTAVSSIGSTTGILVIAAEAYDPPSGTYPIVIRATNSAGYNEKTYNVLIPAGS